MNYLVLLVIAVYSFITIVLLYLLLLYLMEIIVFFLVLISFFFIFGSPPGPFFLYIYLNLSILRFCKDFVICTLSFLYKKKKKFKYDWEICGHVQNLLNSNFSLG
jgi:hypothetical protein